MSDLGTAQFALAPALALTLLHSLWQVALLAAAAALALSACAQRRAALRHALGMGFLVAMVVVPALTFVRLWSRPAGELSLGPLQAMTATVTGGIAPAIVRETVAWPALLSALWLLGVAAMLVRHFGGWRLVNALDRAAYEHLPADWQRRVAALQSALRISRTVSVRLAADIAGPFTARLLRPVIWLPLSLLARLPVEQLEVLIAHELAHIARLDWLWNGVQCVVESLLFFHPGAWWLGRRIRQEREHAADDLAVAACGAAPDRAALALAEALAQLACDRQPFPRLVLAAQGGSLMQRITRLLTGDESRPRRWRWPVAFATVLVVGSLVTLQAGAVHDNIPNIRIESTHEGELGPNGSREIRATGFGHERYYLARKDAQGRLTEVYEEDGKPRPIDAKVRQWIAKVQVVPPPPPPPPVPLPPPPPPPAHPPPPPAPPELAELDSVQDLVRVISANPAVTARTGTPVRLLDPDIDGSLSLEDINGVREGSADLVFELGGPKGEVIAAVEADIDGTVWEIEELEVSPRKK